MKSKLAARLDKLEAANKGGLPTGIFATCQLPHRYSTHPGGGNEPITEGVVKDWIARGLAHVGFNGHAIMYDGGIREGDLTSETWSQIHAAAWAKRYGADDAPH